MLTEVNYESSCYWKRRQRTFDCLEVSPEPENKRIIYRTWQRRHGADFSKAQPTVRELGNAAEAAPGWQSEPLSSQITQSGMSRHGTKPGRRAQRPKQLLQSLPWLRWRVRSMRYAATRALPMNSMPTCAPRGALYRPAPSILEPRFGVFAQPRGVTGPAPSQRRARRRREAARVERGIAQQLDDRTRQGE